MCVIMPSLATGQSVRLTRAVFHGRAYPRGTLGTLLGASCGYPPCLGYLDVLTEHGQIVVKADDIENVSDERFTHSYNGNGNLK